MQKESREVRVTMVPHHQLDSHWGHVSPGLAKAVEKSDNEISLERIYEAIKGGHWWLWILVVGSEYGGCVVTEIIQTDSNKWMNIPFSHTVSPGDRESANAGISVSGLKHFEGLAKSFGCTGLKFLSSRRGFRKIAREAGFEERFVEYVKRF